MVVGVIFLALVWTITMKLLVSGTATAAQLNMAPNRHVCAAEIYHPHSIENRSVQRHSLRICVIHWTRSLSHLDPPEAQFCFMVHCVRDDNLFELAHIHEMD